MWLAAFLSGKLIQRYIRNSDSLLLGMLLPTVFTRLIPTGMEMSHRALLVPAVLLGMISSVFLKDFSIGRCHPLPIAVGNVMLGWLWWSGNACVPLWLCFLWEGLFLRGKETAVCLPWIGIGILLPPLSNTAAGVITMVAGALSLQNTVSEIKEPHPVLLSAGVATGVALLLI